MPKFIALKSMTNSIPINARETSITLLATIESAKILWIFYA
jgi:hypothetical protein